MSIGVMRAQKIKGGSDTVGLQIHNRRERENSNTNPDIKHDLTAQNYSLRDTERTYNEAIEQRMKEGYKAQKTPRKDAVRLVELLFTSDSEFFARLTAEQEREFFRECYKFASEQFGEDNIIAATVHKDEKTPHLHLDFVPLTSDGRLSAKDVLGDKYALQRLQDAFNSVVGAKWGLSRGNRADLSEEKPRKHTKTEEYKRQLETECAQLEQERQELTQDNRGLLQKTIDLFREKPTISHAKRIIDRESAISAENERKAAELVQRERNIGKAEQELREQASRLQADRNRHNQLIQAEALRLLEKTLQEDNSSNKREKRLEAFCDKLRTQSGQTVLEKFEQKEQERKQRLSDNIRRGR